MTKHQNRLTHPACGRTWRQKGNASGHCATCHETFYGITAFDAHLSRGDDGRPICRHPDTITKPGPWWRDDDGQWHLGKRMTPEQIREAWGR